MAKSAIWTQLHACDVLLGKIKDEQADCLSAMCKANATFERTLVLTEALEAELEKVLPERHEAVTRDA